ncbi:MAG: 4-oxalocrotonate decarboxylase [Sphingomonadaceae bacterium]|nr:4-oxalocrotonate decarboxylase [Sphingomonadaceae bacterium]NCA01711.1 4-oxalocrotonate decarboxylase [Sphingomonadaceae bacterium]
MLDSATRNQIVADLIGTYHTRTPLPLLTQTYPQIEMADSYAIQQAFVAHSLAQGRSVRGYKVGLTSKAMQEMSNATEPDFSAMTDDLFLPEDTPLEHSRFFRPLIEIEIAFVMKTALKGPGILPVDVLRATDFVLPAIEIVDFRVGPAPGMTVLDTVADLAACGVAVLGANPRKLEDIDLRRVHGQMIVNGKVEQKGYGSAVLGNPVTAVAWLANKLGEFGITFEPGQTILTGSLVRAMPVKAGDEVVARFDSGLGDVLTSFV